MLSAITESGPSAHSIDERDAIERKVPLEYDEIDLKKLMRRVDLRVLPLITIVYLLCFMDRVNVGFARLYGLEKDLGLTQAQFSWTLSIFFISYALFEIPSNLMLKRVSPSKWIARIMVTWGIVTMCLAAVTNFGGLLAGRFFLGVAEAGLVPGLVYYLTFWYTKKEQAFKIATFFSASNLAGAFSGLLSYAIHTIGDVGSVRGWQWIFIIEGAVTVVIGILVYFFLPNTPDNADWLSPRERRFILDRLLSDHTNPTTKKFEINQLIESFKDYKVWLFMGCFIGFTIPNHSTSQLLPTVIRDMGYSNVTSMLMTTPPYVVSFATTLLISWNSDRVLERCYHFCASLCVGIVAFVILSTTTNNAARYIACFLAIIGFSASFPVTLVWLSSNLVGSTKSGVSVAMVLMAGNLGGIVGGQLYRQYERPAYIPSHVTNCCFMLFALICAITLKVLLTRANMKLEAMAIDQEFCEKRDDGIDIKNFRYIL